MPMVSAQTNFAPVFSVDQVCDAFGITESKLQADTERWWKQAFTKAKLEVDARQKAIAQDAYANKDIKTPLGSLIAEFDAREYFWLKEQYGPDVFKNYDFIMCYRKYRDQQQLATPSRSSFET